MFGDRESSLLDLGKSSKFAITFFISFVIAKLLGLVFTKIFTNTLSESDMGLYSIITSAVALVIGFSSFGFTTAVNRYTIKFKISKNLNDFKNFIFTGIITYIVALFIVTAVILIVYFFTRQGPWFLNVENYIVTVLLITLVVFAQIFSTICYTIATSLQNSRYYTSIIIMRVLLQIPFGMLFVIFLDFGIFGLVIGLALSETVVAIYSIYRIFKDIGIGRFSLQEFKKIVTYALPSYYVGNVWQGFNLLVLLMVDYFYPLTGTETIGLYRYGALLVTNLILIAGNLISMVYRPVIYRMFEKKEHDRIQVTTKKILKMFLMTILPLGLALYAFSPLLIVMFTNLSYIKSIHIIPFLLVAVVFKYLHSIIGYGHSLYFKLYWDAISVTLALGVGFLVAYFVIPINALVGLGASFFAIRVVYSMGAILVSQRYYKIKHDVIGLIKLSTTFIISVGVGVLFYFFVFNDIAIYNVTISFSISLVLFILAVIITKQIKKDDISFFTSMFKDYFKRNKQKNKSINETAEK